jgi:outer membrane lipoprotein-sorting protein
MKRIIALLAACAFAAAAFAQTPEEIVAKMDEVMNGRDLNQGFRMTMDLKIPILGTFSTTAYTLGDKMRMEGEIKGKKMITWQDAETEWEYLPDERKVTIKRRDPQKKSSEEENMKMFQSATVGYDVFLKSETEDAWCILCKKNKSNKEKDDPKTMEIVIAKDTYFPMSLSAKLKGITLTMRDLGFSVTEEEVTYDPDKLPGVIIIDERK